VAIPSPLAVLAEAVLDDLPTALPSALDTFMRESVFGLLLVTQPVGLSALAFDIRLVALDLLLVLILLPLQVVADQGTGSEAKPSTDGRPRSRVPHGCSDYSTCSRAAKSANTRTFFSRRKRTARAANEQDRGEHDGSNPCVRKANCSHMGSPIPKYCDSSESPTYNI
jgi:hypothetical protein